MQSLLQWRVPKPQPSGWTGLPVEFHTFLVGLALPDAPLPVDPASLVALLAHLPAARHRCGCRSARATVRTVIILAKLAGATRMRGIARWGRLRATLQVARPRLPCANTSTRRCATVDLADLNRRRAQFVVPPGPPLPATPVVTAVPTGPSHPGRTATLPWMAQPCGAPGAAGTLGSRRSSCSASML